MDFIFHTEEEIMGLVLTFILFIVYPTFWFMLWATLEENGHINTGLYGSEVIAILCFLGFIMFYQPYVKLLDYLFG